MPETPEKFFLTTPIYYVNARPHIGHAYTTLVADVLARRHRLTLGAENVWFLTGTDEHGMKIERSSIAAGIPPQEFTDRVSAEFRQLWDRMGLTYDQYIRTTDPAHKSGVQHLFRQLQASGDIYLSSYTGQYCVSEEIFVEGPPGTIGPDGRPTETVTEENYFFRLGKYQQPLIDLIESGTLDVQPEARRNELLSFLRGPVNEPGAILAHSAAGNAYVPGTLRDLSISRSSFTWGIPVPGDERHFVYVWLDALANYMTAVGYGDESRHADFKRWWPADLHIVGKEIIRQHCIYWPAFLLAANLPLPRKVIAHGWLLFEESKMSKSKGNIVRAETILDAFGALCPAPPQPTSDLPAPPTKRQQDLFAADVLRYFLLREIPFGQDGSFSFDALITRYNAELANGYGNLVSRVLALIQKTSDGVIEDCPEVHGRFSPEAQVWFPDEPADEQMIDKGALRDQLRASRVSEIIQTVAETLPAARFAEALQAIQVLLGWTDRFITVRKPWAAAETEAAIAERRYTLNAAAQSIRILTALLYPILPYATTSVWRQLGLGDIDEAARNGELNKIEWGGLKPGTRLGPLAPIFPRADKGLAQIMADMELQKTQSVPAQPETAPEATTAAAAGPRTTTLAEPNPGALVAGSAALTSDREPPAPIAPESPASNAPADSSPQIGIEDFAKVELRVARVLVCERIPKADKLLRLEVDLGYEKRQILSGIAEWYTPEDLIGRRIVVITNLAPRKMRGLESHGMLLAASGPEGGKPALATFLDSDELPLGARLK
jgi:methionyl-tRNA synthetase